MTDDIPEEASYPNRKSGMKSACGTRFPCPRWNSPIQVHRQFQVKTLGGVTSLPSIPTIPIPKLDTIQHPVHEKFNYYESE